MAGYTKVDNWLFDVVMPEADPGEYKIVSAVYRKTVGWNKVEDKISLSQFQKLTGIVGRNNVIRSIQEALDNGFISRRPAGQSYLYQCCPTSNESLLVEGATSNESLPELVTNHYQELVTNQYTQKDNIKDTTKPNDGGDFTSVYRLYQNEIDASISKLTSDLVEDAVNEYGSLAVEQAIKIAVQNNVRKWSYIDGILKRRRAGGFSDNGTGHKQKTTIDEETGGIYV